MKVQIPAVRRRAKCASWLAGLCHYGDGCRCRAAELADQAEVEQAEPIPPARRQAS